MKYTKNEIELIKHKNEMEVLMACGTLLAGVIIIGAFTSLLKELS